MPAYNVYCPMTEGPEDAVVVCGERTPQEAAEEFAENNYWWEDEDRIEVVVLTDPPERFIVYREYEPRYTAVKE